MALNQLIAQGGTNIQSPVRRYLDTRKQMETEKRNQLAMAAQQQQMQTQNQTMQMARQKQKVLMGKAYAEAITPIVQSVDRGAESATDKQAAWSRAYPEVERIAGKFGIPLDDRARLWNQTKATSVIGQYGKEVKAPTTSNIMEGPETVYRDWDSKKGQWKEVGRGIKSQATGSYDSFSRGATVDVEKQLTKNLLARDKITTGINFVMQNQDLFDVGSRLSAGVGNALEFVGVDAPAFLRDEVGKMADLKTYSLNIANGIRKETTGAASSYKELDKFIYPLVSVATDGKTRAIKRMQSLVMFNELTTVRLNKLLRDGYKVTSKQGDKTMTLRGPSGKSVAVQKAFPLSSIPVFNIRKGQLLDQAAKGKKPSDFSEQDKKAMYQSVMNEMAREGYNTNVSRRGWGL